MNNKRTIQRSFIVYLIAYAVGYWAGTRYGGLDYFLGSVLFIIAFEAGIKFVSWVLRGYKINFHDEKMEEYKKRLKPDKFNWHNKK